MELKFPQQYIIAARLTDPMARVQVDFDQAVDWCDVLQVLIKNKVPLSSLNNDPRLEDCPLVLNVAFKEALQAEILMRKGLHDKYGELREALLKKGIQSILFKSSGLSPSFPYTSDNLDTLVRLEHVSLSRQALNALGYVELRNVEEPQKWLFRKFRGGESISAIHLHGVVGWGVPFLDDSALWKRARASEDDPWVMIPAPEDALLITIAHALYENKSFKLLDIARIRHCLRQENFDFSSVERIARQRGWVDGLAFCLLLYSQLEVALYNEMRIPGAVLDWAHAIISANIWLSLALEKTLKREEVYFPFEVSFFLGKILYYRKILNDLQRNLAMRIYDVISTLAWGVKLKLQIKGQRGMIIAISGIDGAGKTAHCRSLLRALETSDVKAHIYWSRFGSSTQRNDIRRGTEEGNSSDIATSLARRRQRLKKPLLRFSWLAINLIRFIIGSTLHVRFRRWLGGVVICDRYIYDSMVEIQASLPNGSRWSTWAEWLLTLFCPHPDVAWLLDVPAELSVRRQANERGSAAACEELAKQRSKLKALASRYGLRVLPTSSGLDETSSQLVRETLLKYYENYGTWVKALMLSNPNQMNPEKGM